MREILCFRSALICGVARVDSVPVGVYDRGRLLAIPGEDPPFAEKRDGAMDQEYRQRKRDKVRRCSRSTWPLGASLSHHILITQKYLKDTRKGVVHSAVSPLGEPEPLQFRHLNTNLYTPQ